MPGVLRYATGNQFSSKTPRESQTPRLSEIKIGPGTEKDGNKGGGSGGTSPAKAGPTGPTPASPKGLVTPSKPLFQQRKSDQYMW